MDCNLFCRCRGWGYKIGVRDASVTLVALRVRLLLQHWSMAVAHIFDSRTQARPEAGLNDSLTDWPSSSPAVGPPRCCLHGLTARRGRAGAETDRHVLRRTVLGPPPRVVRVPFRRYGRGWFRRPPPSIRLLEQMLVFPSQFSCQLNHRQVTGAGYEHHVKLEPDYVVGVSVTDRGMGNAEEPNKVPPHLPTVAPTHVPTVREGNEEEPNKVRPADHGAVLARLVRCGSRWACFPPPSY